MYGGEEKCRQVSWWENLKEREHLDDLGVDGRILKCISEKQDGKAWTGLIWLRTGTSGRFTEMKLLD
jgi:hypothetical protein